MTDTIPAQPVALTTYSFRLRDTADAELRRQARAVNFVWNFCRDAQENALRWNKKWPTGYDLAHLTSGSSKELGISSATINLVCMQYAQSRSQHRKPRLRWRGKRSLGWVPVRDKVVRFKDDAFWFSGRAYKAWISRGLQDGQTFQRGSFSQDALGHWHLNIAVKTTVAPTKGRSSIGIDLGLKSLAGYSDGTALDNPRWYRATQARLAVAQHAKHKRQARRLHAKVKAQRADYLHKESLRIVQQHGAVFVGNVSPSAIAKTAMSKSSLDAGWATFKRYLEYKAIARGVLFVEVNEALSSQTCSSCGTLPSSRPKGIAGLGIREWTCSDCGAIHDRDVNAARNILRRGLATLAEGALA